MTNNRGDALHRRYQGFSQGIAAENRTPGAAQEHGGGPRTQPGRGGRHNAARHGCAGTETAGMELAGDAFLLAYLSVFMNFVQTDHNIAKIGQIVELGLLFTRAPGDSQ